MIGYPHLIIPVGNTGGFLDELLDPSSDGIIIPDFPMPHTICHKNLEFSEDIMKKVFYSGPLTGKTYEEVEILNFERPHILSTLGGFGYRESIFRKVISKAQMDSKIHYTLLSGPRWTRLLLTPCHQM